MTGSKPRLWRLLPSAAALVLVTAVVVAAPAVARDKPPAKGSPPGPSATASASGFVFGQLQATTAGATGCGTNIDGEPAIRISADGNVILSSERGVGSGSDAWHGVQPGGLSATACGLAYGGQPNAVSGAGASGGDTDVAVASTPLASGVYRAYVASLNLGSVSVAHSDDGGLTYTNVPVQAGLPGDDREWIAAFGADTSLLTFHDIATGNINVLRSDNGGLAYTQIGEALNPSSTAGVNGLVANQHGNIAIDRINTAGTQAHGPLAGFWAYQAYVAPSSATGSDFNEAYVAVSSDGGFTWADQPVPCSNLSATADLDNQFPILSVDPAGHIWMTWSSGSLDSNGNVVSGTVYAAVSADHGATWACSGPISGSASAPAIMPWIAATSAGVDLVWYQASGSGSSATWAVDFAQDAAGTATGWGAPTSIVTVHRGSVCEAGASCLSGRQLFDDFGVAADPSGWAHIAYSQDSPSLGGSGTSTGYAVQTSGTQVGASN